VIFNINQFKESSNYFDYCIIGCGVAGITLALKLSIFSKVIIVESGGFELDERNQRLNQGKIQYNGFESNHGEDYLSNLRLRMIGGTSNHWAGYCCPFRKIDFKNRHYINKKEWPINYSEYLKYVDEASTICKLNGNFNLPNEFKDSFFKGRSIFLPFYEQISQSPNFKDNYLEKLINNKNVTILYNANLDRMLFESKTIKKIRLKSLEGEIRFINSKNVILATGAAENFRILKDHLEKYENDLIQIKNSLGKNFMEHLTVPTVGYGLRLAKNNESAESHLKFKNKYGLIHYELSEEIQKKFALYNNQISIRSSDYIDDITKLSRNEIEIVKILKKNYSND
jgi:choline dehydrogenase-like flavoprotein